MRSTAITYRAMVLTVVIVPLLATVFAMYTLWQRAVHFPDLLLLLIMYSLVALGVTVGYHRMLTHRSFKPHPIVKFILLVLGSMAWEGPALQWAATHIKLLASFFPTTSPFRLWRIPPQPVASFGHH